MFHPTVMRRRRAVSSLPRTTALLTLPFGIALAVPGCAQNGGAATTAAPAATSTPVAAINGPTLTIDVAADRHLISPDIYGINDYGTSIEQFKALAPTVYRWGGNRATRYNWQNDGTNSGDDWFYLAAEGHDGNNTPSKSTDEVVDRAKSIGGKALLTIPIIDYINGATRADASYPVALYGAQEKVNPFVKVQVNGKESEIGNGRTKDGKPIVLDEKGILRVHVRNSTEHQQAWIKYLVKKYGTAAKGGVAIYELDNEPGGWANTHRDIYPKEPTYQEITDKSILYAKAIKQADPTAQTDGPGDFGWPVYKGTPEKQGGLWNAEYFLQRMAQESKKTGVRLLDYFDEHYYPTAQDGQNDAVRLESTRSLWDSTYVEKNWIGQWNGAIMLIPRMRGWVDKHYPGTKTAITEYNWGGLDTLNGALAQADVLGIFGRERLDLATMWGPPGANLPAAFAFKIYRNFDGKGGQFGNIGVRSVSTNQSQLAIYGAQRKVGGALTLVVINKTGGDLTSPVKLAGFTPGGPAAVYRYSGANLKAIVPQANQTVQPTGFTATFPANSVTLFLIPRQAPGTATAG